MIGARPALIADTIGCGVGGAGLLASRRLWMLTALPTSWRIPCAALLLLFAAFTGWHGSRNEPDAGALRTTACLNGAWTLAGLAAIPQARSRTGRLIVVLIAAADAALGLIQWRHADRSA